ncbi:hypothetical protein P7L54_16695 [Acinetobacter bereziniae]|nr:hypothetical protein [Acinetobacter bereziniae]MDG3557584.1 hypothetical protein [Acinetobacter bereziniae]
MQATSQQNYQASLKLEDSAIFNRLNIK